jgi:hypothetical protein
MMPDREGASMDTLGPFTQDERSTPHIYARDITSAAGDCVCKAALGDDLHTEAAPGVPVPDMARQVCKSAEPQRYVLGVAYQAGPDPRIAKGQDGGRDYFTEAELEKAAWKFLQNGPRVGLFHLDGTDAGDGAATVVESYIYRGPDWDLGDGIVAKSGDWLVGAVLSPKAWDLHLAGKLNGWSPQGIARRRHVRPTA